MQIGLQPGYVLARIEEPRGEPLPLGVLPDEPAAPVVSASSVASGAGGVTDHLLAVIDAISILAIATPVA